MASAILIDATVVHLLLVPAVTQLRGRWNWYMPGALDRRLPHLAVGHEEDHLLAAVLTIDVADGRRGSSVIDVETGSLRSWRTVEIA